CHFQSKLPTTYCIVKHIIRNLVERVIGSFLLAANGVFGRVESKGAVKGFIPKILFISAIFKTCPNLNRNLILARLLITTNTERTIAVTYNTPINYGIGFIFVIGKLKAALQHKPIYE